MYFPTAAINRSVLDLYWSEVETEELDLTMRTVMQWAKDFLRRIVTVMRSPVRSSQLSNNLEKLLLTAIFSVIVNYQAASGENAYTIYRYTVGVKNNT